MKTPLRIRNGRDVRGPQCGNIKICRLDRYTIISPRTLHELAGRGERLDARLRGEPVSVYRRNSQ